MPGTFTPAAAEGMPNYTHRESDDSYQPVVAYLSPKWRVIECRDRIQWILQHVDGKRACRTRWAGWRYLRTRDGLIASCRRFLPEMDASALATLHALPERI